MQIPFAVETREGFSREASREDLLNWFPVVTKKGIELHGTPGTELWASMSASPIRGWIIADEFFYVVIYNRLYKVSNDATYVLKDTGTIKTNSGRVQMAYNGNYDGAIADQILIVDGTDGYIYDTVAETLTVIADADFPNTCDTCIFFGGYFIVGVVGTGRFFWSSLYEGTGWNGLDFATAESNHDALNGMAVTKAGLWMFGTATTEVWAITGDADLPFIRMQGAGDKVGLKAVNSLALWGREAMFIGTTDDGNVSAYQTNGYQIQDKSDPWFDFQISDLTDLSDAIGWSYSMDGRTFYVVTFDTDDKTFATDQTGLWHRRSTGTGRHIGEMHLFFNDKHLISDYSTGIIYELKLSATTDNGTKIKRSAVGTNIQQGVSKFQIADIEIRTEIKYQPTSGQGSDPKIALDLSKDDDEFGTKKFTSMGSVGDNKRVRWSRLGSCRKFVPRLTCDEPVNPIILGMWMNEPK